MADQPAAKIASVSTSFLLAGYATSASQGTLPLLYNLPPATSSTLFKGVFTRGLAPVVTGAVILTSSSGYLAFSNPAKRKLYAIAAALPVAAMGFTAGFMVDGIQKLIAFSEGSGGLESAEVGGLLRAWTVQNFVRAGLYLGSGFLATWAIVGGK